MKNSMKILLAATVLSGAGLFASVPAVAQPGGFSFRIGDVGMAYNDGYYDRSHQWHRWGHNRERDWYRNHYRASYRSMRHDRDHDGVPNQFDSRPNNPYRR
jgi:hypothetical protein